MTAVTVRAPASSANLGPGYDVLAAALSLELELEVEETGSFSVTSEVAGVPRDRSNLCVRAFESLHSADRVSFRISSEIPLGAGLGSSAAAAVAGLMAAQRLYGIEAPVYEHAVALEGHPDNAAAALSGGFVVCSEGPPLRLEPPLGLEAVLAIPPAAVRTSEARALLPAEIPIADAVHNVAHAALLVLGLTTGDLDLIARGLSDRIHQPRRRALYPHSMELVERARALGALGASISGAGPSVLFWATSDAAAGVAERVAAAAPECDTRRLGFAASGARVA